MPTEATSPWRCPKCGQLTMTTECACSQSRTSAPAWMFYHDGVYSPAEESELRAFSERLGLFSDSNGIASVVMEQMWVEIDRLRLRVKELEDER